MTTDRTAASRAPLGAIFKKFFERKTACDGRIETIQYLTRVLDTVPYGLASRLRHIVFAARMAVAANGPPVPRQLDGITALELDGDGRPRHEGHLGVRLAPIDPARKRSLIEMSF